MSILANASTKKPGEPEILNLNESMIIDLISKVEQSIFASSKQLQELEPDLKSAESLYLPLKTQWDAIQGAIEKDKQTLAVLIGHRDNKNERKKIRVHRSISNATPRKKYADRKPFTKELLKLLEEKQKFLSAETAYRLILEKNPEWQKTIQPNEKSRNVKNLLQIAYYATSTKSPKNPVRIYEGKLGLASFLDSNGSPKPEFLKSLMQAV